MMAGGSLSVSTLQLDLGDPEQQARDLRARQSALDKLRNGTSQDGKSLSENGTRKRMRFGEEEGNDTKKKVTRPCRDFASGECKFGTSCRFSHAESAQQRPYEERWKAKAIDMMTHGAARVAKASRKEKAAKVTKERTANRARQQTEHFTRSLAPFSSDLTPEYSHTWRVSVA